jgi:hypothetical protein
MNAPSENVRAALAFVAAHDRDRRMTPAQPRPLQRARRVSRRDDAIDWLRKLLTDGPRCATAGMDRRQSRARKTRSTHSGRRYPTMSCVERPAGKAKPQEVPTDKPATPSAPGPLWGLVGPGAE